MDRIEADIWTAKDVARLLALVEGEKRYYQDMLTVFPIPAAIVGRDLSLLSINREFRRRFLPHVEEEAQRRLSDVLHATVIREQIVPAFDRTGGVHNAEITVLSTTGVSSPWILDAIPVADVHHDAPAEVLVVLRNVVERDSGLGQFLDQAGTILWKLDPASGEIEFANEAASKVFGFQNAHEWMNRVYAEDERRVAWVYEAVIESAREATVEYRIHRQGREPVWASDQLLPIKRADGKVGIVRIVTTLQGERRSYINEVVQAREMETAMRLARQVAHEFNNLWMIVNGYAEVLESRPNLDQETSSGLDEIAKASIRGIETTRQLLEFGRPRAIETRVFDLNQMLRDRDLGAELSLMAGVAPVSAAPDALEEALRKLIEYIRSRSESEPNVTIETARQTRASDFGWGTPRGPFVVIRLGPVERLTPSTIEHWCEPYFSEQERVAPIGLAMVYSKLRQMGISIRLQPNGGNKGAFLLYLPLGRMAEAVKPKPVPVVREIPQSTTIKETVLAIDGDESIRGLIGRILGREGYQVLTAATADEAVATARSSRTPPAILISDLGITGMRGSEVTKRLREFIPGLRVLYVSAFTDDPDLMKGDLPQGEGFLQKPFTISALSELVRTVLDTPKN